MGAIEQHYLNRSKALFGSEYEDEKRYRASNDTYFRLPTLSTRYQSSYYINSARAAKTQVVVKIVSRTYGSVCVNRLGDYIARDISLEDSKILGKEGYDIESNERLILEDQNGNIYATKEERRAVIKEWSVDFRSKESYQKQEWKEERLHKMGVELSNIQALIVTGKATDQQKDKCDELEKNIDHKKYTGKDGKVYDLNVYLPKDTTHMILSVGGKPANDRELKKATVAVREYLTKNFAEIGHKYLFTAHNDTENLHFHVIIKNCNEFDRKSLRMDKADLFMLRQSFARELELVGFERGAELRKDREHTLEKITKGIELLHQNQTWYQNHLSRGTNKGFDAFTYRARAINKTNFLLGALKAEEKYTSLFQLSKFGQIRTMRDEIKSFREKLTSIRPIDLEKEKELLRTKLSKESEFIANKIQKISSFTQESMADNIKRKQEQNLESTALFIESHIERLQSASKELKNKHDGQFLLELSTKADRFMKETIEMRTTHIKKDRDMDFEGF